MATDSFIHNLITDSGFSPRQAATPTLRQEAVAASQVIKLAPVEAAARTSIQLCMIPEEDALGTEQVHHDVSPAVSDVSVSQSNLDWVANEWHKSLKLFRPSSSSSDVEAPCQEATFALRQARATPLFVTDVVEDIRSSTTTSPRQEATSTLRQASVSSDYQVYCLDAWGNSLCKSSNDPSNAVVSAQEASNSVPVRRTRRRGKRKESTCHRMKRKLTKLRSSHAAPSDGLTPRQAAEEDPIDYLQLIVDMFDDLIRFEKARYQDATSLSRQASLTTCIDFILNSVDLLC